MSSNKQIHTHKFRIKPLKVHRRGHRFAEAAMLPCPIILSTVAEMDIVVPPNRVLCMLLETSHICTTSKLVL